MSAAKTSKGDVLAREGDELWQIEMMGKAGKDLKHVTYFWLVDPFRKKGGKRVPAAWIIHENRFDLVP